MAENYTFKNPRQQYFLLPPNIIYHLWRFPLSPISLQKLYQTCKYFFAKNQVLITHRSAWFNDRVQDIHLIDFISFQKKTTVLPQHIQYWFSHRLSMMGPNLTLIKNIYRCTIMEFIITGGNITIDEFKIITKENTIKRFAMMSVSSIRHSDGKAVSLDVVLQNLPNLKRLNYDDRFGCYSHEVLARMNQLKFLFDRFSLELHNIHDTFDPLLLCKFIKLNVAETCYIDFNGLSISAKETFPRFRRTVKKTFDKGDKNKPIVQLSMRLHW